MKLKKILSELVCIILFTATFVIIGTENVTSTITIVDDPSPRGGDLAVFSNEISIEFPLSVGMETIIDVDVHNMAVTYAATWHYGDYAEYDFNMNSNAILDIQLRIRSSSDATSTDVHLDGAQIANFNSMPAFDIVTIHDISIASGDHTIRVTQKSDTPSSGDSVVVDWIKIGNYYIEGELYDRSYGTDSNPNYRGVDAIVPSKIKTRFYIDGLLLAENDGVGSHSNLVPGDSLYPDVDFIPNNGISNTYTAWTPSTSGYHNISIEVLSGISSDIDLSNNIAYIIVFVGIPPPELYINISQDKKDAVLNWDPPHSPGIDYYLLYRSTSQTDFNFNDIWVNTSSDKEKGELDPIPLRTMWNDTNSANPDNKTNYNEQYYYTIRAVNSDGQVSRTSRTVGKWTKIFQQGVSSFSLPLEPINSLDTDYLISHMNAEYIKYMDPATRTWRKHNLGDGDVNNTDMKLGEAYEVKFGQQSNYTFMGLPGAMILYDDDNGFSGFDFATDAKNLFVFVKPNGDVDINWERLKSMGPDDEYWVLYSNRRDGFFRDSDLDYELVYPPVSYDICMATHEDAQANDPGARLYYMVLPMNATRGVGTGTYSVGIWTEEYLSQYDTIGIPLKLDVNHTADWYCDNIPNTIGINYYDYIGQRWCWHSARMPEGAFDTVLEMTKGYQISTSDITKFIFIGI
ncbi:MAG: hypothetical protein JSW00_16480 [Thermoplasmata archaeon]|nr:MAG: hypothetical protein JSW00_16480 [Thermoplasmata archaeon]